MVQALHALNQSFDKLVNGTLVEASVSSYEIAWTFGGISWFWPILFLFTLVIAAIKTENPTTVAILAILGNVALGSFLPGITNLLFGMILIFSLLIWFISIFVSRRFG